MRLLDLFEAPIEDIAQVGDWSKNSSYSTQDRKLLNNPKAISKITSQWDKTTVPFNIFLINNPEGRLHKEVGLVNNAWLEQNMPRTFPLIQINPSAVNILFTNNSASEHVPMTGWIMAHRLSHALDRPNSGGRGRQVYEMGEVRSHLQQSISSILMDGYGKRNIPYDTKMQDRPRLSEISRMLSNFYSIIGTMRSARDRKIRDEFEFVHELLAQYMLTGRIKFNPIPKAVKAGGDHFYFQGPESDMEYYNGLLEDCAEYIGEIFNNMLHNCIGRIIVM
jgi:hypothetical protein